MYTRSLITPAHTAQAYLLGSLETIHTSPVRLVRHMVLSSWGLMLKNAYSASHRFEVYDMSRPPPWEQPPKTKTFPQNRILRAWLQSEGILQSSAESCPNRAVYETTLRWQLNVGRYTWDWGVFLSEPQRRRARQEYAKVTFIPSDNDHDQSRLLIMFRSCESVHCFSHALYEHQQSHEQSDTIWPVDGAVILSFYWIFVAVRKQTDLFLRRCHEQIKTVVSKPAVSGLSPPYLMTMLMSGRVAHVHASESIEP